MYEKKIYKQKKPNLFKVRLLSRGGRIRTYDLHIPNVARYRATLHPESVIFQTGVQIYYTNLIQQKKIIKKIYLFYKWLKIN